MKNLEAEQLVLGVILKDNTRIAKTDLNEKHFSEKLHQEIFKLAKEYFLKGLIASPITLKDKLASEIDLFKYLTELTWKGDVISFDSCVYEIKQLWHKREIKYILEAALQKDCEPQLLIEDIEKQFTELQSNASEYRISSFENVVEEIIDETMNYEKKEATKTGFDRLDLTMNGGLERGLTYCLAARPKAGKTMLKGSIANNLRKTKTPFLFIAAEMGRKQIAKRIIGADTGFKINEMNKHNKGYTDYLTSQVQQKSNMFFVDAPRISLEALRLVVTNAVKTKNIEGFILDYLQLVTGKDSKTTIAEHQENVAQTIAEICKKENIWCLYSCQINRSGEVRNGDGIMMACDWLYEITPCGLTGGEESEFIYLKHMATRNFRAADIGGEDEPAFKLVNGTHFEPMR